ncbi:DUF3624 family protein [Pseudaeromonas paramecii]|uniref:DUF3624 domain-containing protein n=1 Tax=Pseudaeromonas paramecii TaxID=2138166 RepID=A0ABP8QJ01_9GAMM
MACRECERDEFWHKLGRCRGCMLGCALIALLSGLIWRGLGADGSVPALTALLFLLGSGGLLALHLLVWSWRRLTGADRQHDEETR